MPNDDLDMMLQGKDQDIPSESQSGTEGTGSNSDNPNEGSGGQPEEVEFNRLSGAAQDRFRAAFRDKQRLVQENEKLRQLALNGAGMPLQNGVQLNSDQLDALNKLDQAGVATKDFVQKQINDILARKSFFDDLDKLEHNLNGSDGRPKFVREEYEEYISRHPQYKSYLPNDVYNIMYEEELLDWKVQGRSNPAARKSSTTLKPTRTSVRDTDLTMEQIEEKLKSLVEPQRSEWYNANLKKINEVLGRSA